MLGWRKDKQDDTTTVAAATQQPGRTSASRTPDISPSSADAVGSRNASIGNSRNRLGAMLVQEGIITAGQLEEALKKKGKDGGFLGQALIELRYIDQSTLINFLVKQCKIPHINLAEYVVSESLFEFLPKATCVEYNCLPIDKLGRILTVAMVDPFDTEAIDAIMKATPDLRIKPILCNWADFSALAARLLGKERPQAKEATAGSFGLAESKPKPRPAETPPKSAVPVPPPSAPQSAGPIALSDSGILEGTNELAGVIRSGIREAVQEALASASQDSPQATGISPQGLDQLAGMLQETMRNAIQDISQTLVQQAASPGAGSGVSSSDFEAIQESLASLAIDLKQAAFASKQHLDAAAIQHLAGAIAESVRTAIVESSSTVIERSSAAPALDSQHLAAVIQQSVDAAVRASVNTLAAAAPQVGLPSQDTSQIATLAEAASQAVRAAEAAIQAARAVQATQAAQIEMEEERRSRFRTVRPMGNGEPGENAPKPAKASGDERVRDALESDNTIAAFTFDGFLVSKSNEFAFNVCKAIAADPGKEYNPLFLYGDVGIGKTHLINATGNQIRASKPDFRVGYVSAGLFARKLMEAVSQRHGDAFRENYCHWDVLILDDIQFLGYEVAAQEELFHIFNALYQEGRQIIIAADNPPDRLGKLEKRLVSRFTAGIVAKLDAPDFKTRVEILANHAKQHGAKINHEILSIIATRIPHDVRRMCGAFRKVIAFGKLVGQDITCDLAYEVLTHLDATDSA